MEIAIIDHTPDSAPINVPERDPFRMTKLIREVAAKHGSNPEEFRGRCLMRHLVRARQEYCYRALTELHAPILRIARSIGRKNYETIYIAIAIHCSRLGLPFPSGFNGPYWLSRQKGQIARRRKK